MAGVCLFSQQLQVRHKVSWGLKVGRRPTLIGLRTECLAAPSLAAAINGTGPKENWYVALPGVVRPKECIFGLHLGSNCLELST